MTSIRHPHIRPLAARIALLGIVVFACGSSARTIPAVEAHTATSSVLAAEAPFIAENEAAMKTMMRGMAAMPSGDVDRDFVAMMVPHHQGAIDMAVTVLRYGRNERIKRLAQEIIVTQQQEIAAMRLAIGEPLPDSQPSPTQPAPIH